MRASVAWPGGGRALRDIVDRQVRPCWTTLRSSQGLPALSPVARGALGVRYTVGDNREHARAAMDWLCAAQDAAGDGGVSAFYDVVAGAWALSYPETTGYIIPTFFDYAAATGMDAYRSRAIRMADWLLTLQLESGAFPALRLSPLSDREPIVFDTGQVIHGLVRSFEETGDSRYRIAVKRAADWLTDIQGGDGNWTQFTFLGHSHTYNARVAWALLRTTEIVGGSTYLRAAIRNLAWTLAQQTPDGWFHNAGFRPEEEPLTHTIAYTVRGLLESGALLSEQLMVDAASLAADALLKRQSEDGYLRGTYGPGWRSSVSWSCLTGDVQMAFVWLRLHQMTGDRGYLRAALAANRFVKQAQCRKSGLAGVRGGIAGSFPLHGGYMPYLHLNWAAKFLIDSLLLEDLVRREWRIG